MSRPNFRNLASISKLNKSLMVDFGMKHREKERERKKEVNERESERER